MNLEPCDLVAFGDEYDWPAEGERPAVSGVVLEALLGPTLGLPGEAVVVADPWWPETFPEYAHFFLPSDAPVVLGTVSLPHLSAPLVYAAAVGRVEEVDTWLPLAFDGEDLHLEVDTGLGAFFDVTDTALLKQLFTDDEYTLELGRRVLEEKAVAVEAEGRVVAVLFECGMGDGSYPVYLGFNVDGAPKAMLVDLELLHRAESRTAGSERVGQDGRTEAVSWPVVRREVTRLHDSRFPTLRSVVLDCPDPLALARFYADLLGLEVHPESDAERAVVEVPGGTRLAFQHAPNHVPPQWPDGQPQQAHLDLLAPDLDAHQDHALEVGAIPFDVDETREETVERGWRVFLDPAGHPFCLCAPPEGWV